MAPDTASHTLHLSVTIGRPASAVYEFAADPANLPSWAAGLASSPARRDGERWIIESPMGEVTVEFTPRNAFGILDHTVTLPTGEEVYNPMRVTAHGAVSDVVFTLYRQTGMSDEEFAADAAAVRRDLESLKLLLETP